MKTNKVKQEKLNDTEVWNNLIEDDEVLNDEALYYT